MTVSPEAIQEALSKARDFASLCHHLLAGALGWPIPDDLTDPEELTFEWAEADLRARGLDRWLNGARVLQLQNLVRGQRWGIFIVEFAQDVFTAGRGMTGPLRQVLRGLVTSARRKSANLPSWAREDLLFICTHRWTHYAVARFSAPAEKGRAPKLATFGWSADAARRTRTVVDHNLPPLEWPDDPDDADGWRSAWSKAWDKEALTKDFFRAFAGDPKKGVTGIYHVLRKDIASRNKLPEARAGEKALLILNRLLFLYFIQKKGWLAQDQDFLRRAFKRCEDRPHDTDFYAEKAKALPGTTGFLYGLFARLALEDSSDPRFSAVPFLNGGLFEPDAIDADLKISNETFHRIFDELLDRYNFTVTEDTPLDVEVAIDPEMLGKVFECLVLQGEQAVGILAHERGEVEDKRKITGSYYTPRAVVHFMCQEALRGHLQAHTDQATDADAALNALMDSPPGDQIDDEMASELSRKIPDPLARRWSASLRELRACDPAVGSGAFVVGLLHEIVRTRSILDRLLLGAAPVVTANYFYNLKHEVISRSLYGVDIQEQAVRLCELRLWLSLVVDYDLWKGLPELDRTPSEFRRRLRRDLPALPNLSYRIVRGDSLLEWLHGVVMPLQRRSHDAAISRFFADQHTRDVIRSLAAAKSHYFEARDTLDKHRLAAEILDLKAGLVERLLEILVERAQAESEEQQELLSGSAGGARKQARDEIIADAVRWRKALAQVTEVRRRLAFHHREASLPDTDPIQDLELMVFGDTTVHAAFFWRLDFAEAFAEHGGFDIVIANPPYVLLQSRAEGRIMRDWFRRFFKVAAYKIDLYHLFIEQGIDLLASTGTLSYITPSNFVSNNYAVALRRLILTRTSLESLVFFDESVFEASVHNLVTIARKPLRQGSVVRFCKARILHGLLQLDVKSLEAQEGLITDRCLLVPKTDSMAGAIISKMNQAESTLGACASVNFGMQLRHRKKFPRDVVVAPTAESGLSKYHRECYAGKDIQRYRVGFSHRFCYFNEEARRGGCWERTVHNAQDKILVRQVGRFPEGGLDERGYAVLNAAFIIIPTVADVDPFFLLGVLNSSATRFYWMNRFHDDRRTFPKIKGEYLKLLPLPRADAACRRRIRELVRAVIELKREAPGADTRKIEQSIDDDVCNLYGLTSEEKKIVEGVLPSSRAEDEAENEEE